ncbi:hypothetical protein RN001_005626 [Aquatica leii]|uniref:Myb/SANT-like DNA-binding domain-containing protein n=1 Tax=Aquatica leii TaxID=1421715 RepID=A0AAN7Q1J1_9COLE|nr:hypothetical protein RN001_005626 [Aquatica leii]
MNNQFNDFENYDYTIINDNYVSTDGYDRNNYKTITELAGRNPAHVLVEVDNTYENEEICNNFNWTHNPTLLLLDEYHKRATRFRNPKIKKKTLWEEISQVMINHGNSVDRVMLDRKMRNMKSTFNKIKDNNKKTRTGRGRVSYEYFEKLNEIFAEDKIVNISNVISSTILLPETPTEQPRKIDFPESPRSGFSGSVLITLNTPSNDRKKQKH